jgi:hypothetical protein
MEEEQARVQALQAKHLEEQLTDEEVSEFYDLQLATVPRSRAYGRVVAAMYTFVPYLETRPQLIEKFVEVLYFGAKNTFAGINDQISFLEFLDTKAVVDDKLRAAVQQHRQLFKDAIEKVTKSES